MGGRRGPHKGEAVYAKAAFPNGKKGARQESERAAQVKARPQWLEAHERLVATLPSIMHSAIPPAERMRRYGSLMKPHTAQPPVSVKRGEPRALMLQGVRYESVETAARALGISDTAVGKRIRRGLGSYI